MALYFIGGIIKHARALNAITNPSTNSYSVWFLTSKHQLCLLTQRVTVLRLSVFLTFNPKGKRIEARLDPMMNPYLGFAALLMAGIDGIQNKIHPGEAADKNLYDLPPEEEAKIPTVAHSLDMALEALQADHEFLLKGGVFTKEMLDAYIELKTEDVRRLNTTTHPVEFDMYYSL